MYLICEQFVNLVNFQHIFAFFIGYSYFSWRILENSLPFFAIFFLIIYIRAYEYARCARDDRKLVVGHKLSLVPGVYIFIYMRACYKLPTNFIEAQRTGGKVESSPDNSVGIFAKIMR